MNRLKKLALVILLVVFSQVSSAEPKILLKRGDDLGVLSININQLRDSLLSVQKSIVIVIPLPNGKIVDFELRPESVMAEGLARKYPNIKTFIGKNVSEPSQVGRFDITPNGFHGVFYHNDLRVFVEPTNTYFENLTEPQLLKSKFSVDNSIKKYKIYFGQNSKLSSKSSHKFYRPKKVKKKNATIPINKSSSSRVAKVNLSESTIKTYRIAISSTAEYTKFHGGTVNSAMAEIITLVNRLNHVYQRDLAIKLELVENNDLLISKDSDTDPFNNTSHDGSLNTIYTNNIIGSDSYDIGHVVNTAGGGLAMLGGTCHSIYKGDGVTGSFAPINDAFYIDYVAHEIGHQFGAEHTFNGTAGACLGSRVAESAYEVGSGSSIMSYAGICDEENLQAHTDAFFHSISIEQIRGYLASTTGNTCGVVTGNINRVPIVDAGLNYIIPAQTALKLSGSAKDVDSTHLSYSWQQFDLGNESSSLADQVDDGSRPLFRAFQPSSNTDRNIPQLSALLANTKSKGESLPTSNRYLNFRFVVLDNEGGVGFDKVTITVVDTGEPFAITAPTLDNVWSTSGNISWQVAATNNTPINCPLVDIALSKDNGASFDFLLASGVINNGDFEVPITSFCANKINTNQARLKLTCQNNIFFAINNGPFIIDKAFASTDIAITNQVPLSVIQGESIIIASTEFNYACDETPDTLIIKDGEHYSFSGMAITPDIDFTGLLSVGLVASKGGVTSEVFITSIAVEKNPKLTPKAQTQKSGGGIFWLLFFVFISLRRYWANN